MTNHPDPKPGDVLKAICAAPTDVTGKKLKPEAPRDLTARVTSPATSPDAFAATLKGSPFLPKPSTLPKAEDAPAAPQTQSAPFKEIVTARNSARVVVAATVRERTMLDVGAILRMPNHVCGFRVWKVTAVELGAVGQESAYELRALDVTDNGTLRVPCIMLEAMTGLERL
jgi:hypothetical protein